MVKENHALPGERKSRFFSWVLMLVIVILVIWGVCALLEARKQSRVDIQTTPAWASTSVQGLDGKMI